MKNGGESQKAEAFPMETLGKRRQVVGNSWFQPSSLSILNSNIQRLGPVRSKQVGEAWSRRDKAYSNEEVHRASNSKLERMAQSPLNPSSLV